MKKEKRKGWSSKSKHSVWEFFLGEKARDHLNNCFCRILVQNSSNIQLERRFYVETMENQVIVHRWRTASQLSVA